MVKGSPFALERKLVPSFMPNRAPEGGDPGACLPPVAASAWPCGGPRRRRAAGSRLGCQGGQLPLAQVGYAHLKYLARRVLLELGKALLAQLAQDRRQVPPAPAERREPPCELLESDPGPPPPAARNLASCPSRAPSLSPCGFGSRPRLSRGLLLRKRRRLVSGSGPPRPSRTIRVGPGVLPSSPPGPTRIPLP